MLDNKFIEKDTYNYNVLICIWLLIFCVCEII